MSVLFDEDRLGDISTFAKSYDLGSVFDDETLIVQVDDLSVRKDEIDYFSFEVMGTEPAWLRILANATDLFGTTQVRITDSSGNDITPSDQGNQEDDWLLAASGISLRLQPGKYYIAISEDGRNVNLDSYSFHFELEKEKAGSLDLTGFDADVIETIGHLNTIIYGGAKTLPLSFLGPDDGHDWVFGGNHYDDYMGYLSQFDLTVMDDSELFGSRSNQFRSGGMWFNGYDSESDLTATAAVGLVVKEEIEGTGQSRIYIVFRGTDGWTGFDGEAGTAQGQLEYYSKLRPLVDMVWNYVSINSSQISEVIFTGHSLGGGMVDLASLIDGHRFEALLPDSVYYLPIASMGFDRSLFQSSSLGMWRKHIADFYDFSDLNPSWVNADSTNDIYSFKFFTPTNYAHFSHSDDLVANPFAADFERLDDFILDDFIFVEAVKSLYDHFHFGGSKVDLQLPNMDQYDIDPYYDSLFLAEHNHSLYYLGLSALADAMRRFGSEFSDIDNVIFGNGISDRSYAEVDQWLNASGSPLTVHDSGSNQLVGSLLNDTIFGLSGDDFIQGSHGDDILDGGSGNDYIFGEKGSDRLVGGLGTDHLYGGDNSDYLYGGTGGDTLNGGAGTDYLLGEEGTDTYVFEPDWGFDTVEDTSDVNRARFTVGLEEFETYSVHKSDLDLWIIGGENTVKIVGFFKTDKPASELTAADYYRWSVEGPGWFLSATDIVNRIESGFAPEPTPEPNTTPPSEGVEFTESFAISNFAFYSDDTYSTFVSNLTYGEEFWITADLYNKATSIDIHEDPLFVQFFLVPDSEYRSAFSQTSADYKYFIWEAPLDTDGVLPAGYGWEEESWDISSFADAERMRGVLDTGDWVGVLVVANRSALDILSGADYTIYDVREEPITISGIPNDPIADAGLLNLSTSDAFLTLGDGLNVEFTVQNTGSDLLIMDSVQYFVYLTNDDIRIPWSGYLSGGELAPYHNEFEGWFSSSPDYWSLFEKNYSFDFTILPDFFNRYDSTYQVVVHLSIDGLRSVDTASIEVTLAGFNHSPEASDDSLSATSGAVTVYAADDLLSNDSDPNWEDEGNLVVDSVADAVGGSVTLLSDGNVRFTPTLGFEGLASFSYVVSDGGKTDTATVIVDVVLPPDDFSADQFTTGQLGRASGWVGLPGDIEVPGDVDWFAVELVAGQSYAFRLSDEYSMGGSLSSGLIVGVHDEALQLVPGTDGDHWDEGYGISTEYVNATYTGTYYFAVTGRGGDTGTYWSMVEPWDYEAPASIESTALLVEGSLQEAVIDFWMDADWYSIYLKAGHTYEINQEGSDTNDGSGLGDPLIAGLFDSAGTPIAATSDDNSGEGRNARVTFTAPYSGYFFVSASAVDEGGNLGPYRVGYLDLGILGTEGVDSLVGSPDEDTIYGYNGTDDLYGLAANDVLVGGEGADLLFGGPGLDSASYEGSPIAVNVSLDTGDIRGGDAEGDVFYGIEGLIGSDHNDVLEGDALGNELRGGNGNDTLRGLGGGDHLDGGSGVDTVDYSSSTERVVLSLTHGFGVQGDASGDTFTAIENVTGSAFSDFLEGDGGSNILKGNDGDDSLEGGSGADVLDGGTGTDTAIYTSSAAGVNVDLLTGETSGGDAADDMLDRIENLTSSAFADVLKGDMEANVLTGNGLSDRLYGRGGNDTLSGGQGGDRLYGGAGNDLLDGGKGKDRLDGGNGLDTVTYEGAPSGIAANLGTGLGSGGDAEGDRYTSIENLIGSSFEDLIEGDMADNVLSGNSLSDRLYGRGGDDTLFGGQGGDRLYGGADNDILDGGKGKDRLDGGNGIDTASYEGAPSGVEGNLGISLGSTGDANGDRYYNIENLTGSDFADVLRGDGGDNTLTGGGLFDRLYGMAGDDHLIGGTGGDRLFGGADNDILDGGIGKDQLSGDKGNDTLTGGDGADRFIIKDNSGADTITDFDVASGDIIDLSNQSSSASSLDAVLALATQDGDDLVFDFGDSNTLTLNNIAANELSAGDFKFWSGGQSLASVSITTEPYFDLAMGDLNEMDSFPIWHGDDWLF